MTKASATSEGRISGWQKHLQCPGSSKVFKKKKVKYYQLIGSHHLVLVMVFLEVEFNLSVMILLPVLCSVLWLS